MQPPIERTITPVLSTRGGRPLDRDVFVVALLLILLAVLVVPWVRSGGVLGDSPSRQAAHMAKEAINPWLLPALGLVWVLAGGGLDLSVWVVFALGSVVAARIGAAGGSPMVMLAAVAATGLAVGLIHAGEVRRLRLPSWGVTLISAIIGAGVVWALAGGKILLLQTSAERSWPGQTRPMVLVGSFYTVALLAGLLGGEGRRSAKVGRPGGMAHALIASSLLSALGGLCWLIKWGVTPKPGYLVADVRVAAAAVLAGAAIMKGPGRRLVASVLLVPAMVAATAWRQCVWQVLPLPAGANVALLAGMALAAQWAWVRSRRTGRPWGIIWPALAVGGIVVLAGSAWPTPRPARAALAWAGLGLWLVGVAVTAAQWLRERSACRRHQSSVPA